MGEVVRTGLDEDGNPEPREAYGFDDADLVPEIGEHHDDAVDLVPLLPEEARVFLGVGEAGDGPVGRE